MGYLLDQAVGLEARLAAGAGQAWVLQPDATDAGNDLLCESRARDDGGAASRLAGEVVQP
ncbi:MAG TPA: hypothetical protein VIL71_14190 [Spirillospora sp.]